MSFDAEHYVPPELYDLAYSWYTPDIDFYVRQAIEAGGAVLEAGCGTGRVMLPSLAAGADIDGFDIHPGMLEVLRRKAAARGLPVRVQQADMRDFTMPRRYALVTIPFRAFMHLTTTADQVRALRCIREHLEADGRLVFNLFFPSFEAMVNPEHPHHADREVVSAEDGRRIVLHTTAVATDRIGQVMTIDRELRELDAQGQTIATNPHRFRMRWSWRPEIELLLEKAGFVRYEVRGGFKGRPFELHTDEMVWTAWRD